MTIRQYTCSHCGKPFQRKASEIRTETPCCSQSCAARFRKIWEYKRVLKPPNVTCTNCGKPFRLFPSHIARVAAPTCSRQCNGALRGQEFAKHAHKGRAAWSPEAVESFRKKMSGPNNPVWKGGKITRHRKPYIYVRCPDDLMGMSRKDGYILEHRLVMARHLGRLLTRQETIHHIDGNCRNNVIDNLRLYDGNGPHLSETLAKENPESPWHED